MSRKSLIFLSLNEFNFEIIKKYLKINKLDNLKKISENINFTVSEEDYEKLEPWIQWPSIYTGKTALEHNIFRLGDIVKYKENTIFDEIEGLGFSVGAIGSMNLDNKLKNPKYFISDPWTEAKSDNSFWSKLIQKTISSLVKKNSSLRVSFFELISFALIFFKFAKFRNYKDYFFLSFTGFRYKWRNALFLDLLLNDIHLDYFQKNKPNFSNIFFNGIAHIQHHYLFNSKVIDLPNLKNPNWYLNDKKDPLEEALVLYDKILNDYLDNKNFEVVIATALTQKPYDMIKFYYKIKNHNQFFFDININYKKIQELMSRDFIIYFEKKEDADNAENILNKIRLKDKEIFKIDNRGLDLFVTFVYPNEIFKEDYLDNYKINIYNYISFVAIKNGMHSQNGFYYDSFSNYEKKQINITEIKEKILQFFN